MAKRYCSSIIKVFENTTGLELTQLFSIFYWISRKNSLKLMGLSSINKTSLVQVSSYSNTGSKRDDPYWTSRKNSLELIELSSINKVSFV